MTSAMPFRAALLPGTGSDQFFVRAVFGPAISAAGATLVAPPSPGGITPPARDFMSALDTAAAAAGRPIVVGGISFGAHVAAGWAVRNQARCAGLLIALPAWNGEPGSAPASMAAKLSADLVAREGLEAALAISVAGVPDWLAAELARAWRRHGDGLAASMLSASNHPAPTLADLSALEVPVGIAACVDDPIHPAAVAHAWASALPRAVVRETTLVALGEDRGSLGEAAVGAWLEARHLP